jgi:hypothetical protein
MSGAYMSSLMVVSALGTVVLQNAEKAASPAELSGIIESKYGKINYFFSVIRSLGVLAIMMWIYPYSQLNTADPVAIENDLNNPDKRVLAWWGAMQIGFSLKLIGLAINNLKDKAYSAANYIISGTQFIASHLLAKEVVRRTNPHDWKRVAVSTVNIGAWEVDTLNQFANLPPEKWGWSVGNLQTATAAGLSYGYELRAHLMMGLHVIGIFAPTNETLEDHKP